MTDGHQSPLTSLVLPCGRGQAAVNLDDLVANFDAPLEVILVGANPPDLRGASPTIRKVLVDERVPYAVGANQAAATARGSTICFVGPDVTVSEASLPPLCAAVGRGAAAAVPRLVSTAGDLLESATLFPLGRVDTRTHAQGYAFGCLAIRRSAFQAVGGFDPEAPTPEEAGAELALSLRSRGFETRYVPESVAVCSAPASQPPRKGPVTAPLPPALGLGSTGSDARLLLVHDRLPVLDGGFSDAWVAHLVAAIRSLWPETALTVVGLDGHGQIQRRGWLEDIGVEVLAGPCDWTAWLAQRRSYYTHTIAGTERSFRLLAPAVAATQPQAVRVLAADVPEFRHAAAAAGLQPDASELPGLHRFEGVLFQRWRVLAEEVDAVWCPFPDDAELLRAIGSNARVVDLPLVAWGEQPTISYDERSGLSVLGLPEFDAFAGHEDAVRAAAAIQRWADRRGLPIGLRILTRQPSPIVQDLASDSIEMDPIEPVTFAAARVALGPYSYGTGGRWAATLAVASGTPFVATGLGRSRLPADIRAATEGESIIDLAQRAIELHEDKDRWLDLHERLLQMAAERHSVEALRRKVLFAGAELGLAPSSLASGALAVLPGASSLPGGVRSQPVRALVRRQAPIDRDSLMPSVEQMSDTEQYRRWRLRNGPTPERLRAMGYAVDRLAYRPTISVVMPVFNTDPSVLSDAIDSVRSQVYEHWELCLADDASPQAETRQVLQAAADSDPRIRVCFLEENRGIAMATNSALALASGEFVGFLDHDDELKPHALAEIAVRLAAEPDIDVFYTDWDLRDPDGTLVQPYFKPGWSPDTFMSRNYICHFLVVRKSLLDRCEGLRPSFDGSQDYDLALRLLEHTDRISHICDPLYTWRKVEGSVASVPEAKPYAFEAARRALADALRRRGTPGEVHDGLIISAYRVKYDIVGTPPVSIIIPTRDRKDLLQTCIDSVMDRSSYTNFEILVVDNQSSEPATLSYLATAPVRVVPYPHPFNYARMMNLAAAEARGEYLVFLNNDTEVLAPDWIEALLEHAQRAEVGAVGGRLFYPDGRVQHEGIALGMLGGVAANLAHGGWWGNGDIIRNCSAVTGACTMMRATVFWHLGGNDEHFRVAYNDVDLGLRVRQAGYEVVYTPYAVLRHYEGATRRGGEPPQDEVLFGERWQPYRYLDPYYNPNLDPYRPFSLLL